MCNDDVPAEAGQLFFLMLLYLFTLRTHLMPRYAILRLRNRLQLTSTAKRSKRVLEVVVVDENSRPGPARLGEL